jgi:cytoskeleton protein RodZ
MRITGELLKSERLSQGLTVQQVAASLKLSNKIINAIEAGDSSQLPAKTFVRGFVRSYAEFLKLNPEVVMRQFQEEMGTTSPLPKVPPPPPSQPGESFKATKPSLRQTAQNYSPNQTKSVTSASIKQQNLEEQNLNNKIIMFLFGAVVLVVLIIAGTRIFQTEPTPPVVESDTANVIIPSYDSTGPAVSATAETSSATSVVAAAPVATASTSETGTAVSQTTVAAVTAVNINPAVSGTAAAVIASAKEAAAKQPVTQDEILPPSSGKPNELILEPKKDTEIQYAKGNTNNFKSLKLSANKVQILRSTTGLHIKAPDGGAFKMTVNGLDKGNAGANNKPVKLTF